MEEQWREGWRAIAQALIDGGEREWAHSTHSAYYETTFKQENGKFALRTLAHFSHPRSTHPTQVSGAGVEELACALAGGFPFGDTGISGLPPEPAHIPNHNQAMREWRAEVVAVYSAAH